MNPTRRVVTALALLTGATGMAAPAAHAASVVEPTTISVGDAVDGLSTTGLPAEHKERMPVVTEELDSLGQLDRLNELRQITDLVAPVTNLVPSVQ
ncbi:hypothetical protein [Streptomyces sp. NPDC060194]|uniref:hypothetical protein n=1 Tax=Streptomyces sp. NPDC060194 TaxID=3347069 RepID=UPI00365A3F88